MNIDINDTFNLPHINPREDKYTLRIDAPEDYQGNVKINVYAYQMKEGEGWYYLITKRLI